MVGLDAEWIRPHEAFGRRERHSLRRRRPMPGAKRPRRPISIGANAFGQRPACAG